MEGTGNSFLIFDLRSKPGSLESWLKSWGFKNQKEGLLFLAQKQDVDGLVFLRPSSKGDFGWEFFNRDGSVAEMCGNAARCVVQFIYDQDQKKEVSFQTEAGLVHGRHLSEGYVEVEMPLPQWRSATNYMGESVRQVVVGVPHGVKRLSLGKDFFRKVQNDKKNWAQGLRAQENVNVTFFQEEAAGSLKAISFERGVEDFTKACGTGACAAAVSYMEDSGFLGKVSLQLPGGSVVVYYREGKLFLEGPVCYIQEKMGKENFFNNLEAKT
ncbi:MAG: diaminopimelate epimerase [Bdellovibrio sp.]|nr:MAG: diaminopimelate epimerase [Bdellovibrio sp.]